MSEPADDTVAVLRAILVDEVAALERARGTEDEAAAKRAVVFTRAAIEAAERGEGGLRNAPR